MESRIEELLSKYWSGDTTLTEEAEIKQYLNDNPQLGGVHKYFQQVRAMQAIKPKTSYPYKETRIKQWYLAVAASVSIVATALFFIETQPSETYIVEDTQEAYEVTKKAFLMISDGINRGNQYTTEIKRLNTAQEVIQVQNLNSN